MRAPQLQSLPGPIRPPDFAKAPLLVLWEITRACELACTHCRAEAHPGRDPEELSTAEAMGLLTEIRAMGTPLVVLTGGDPLLRPDVLELVAAGEERGLRMTMTPSVTSGLTTGKLDALKAAGLCRLAVSLDSAVPSVHDGMRGYPGTFDRTLEIMHHCREIGLSLQVNTTVTRTTRGSLRQLPPLLADVGIDLWSVFFLVPTGRAQFDEVPSAEEMEEDFAVLYEAARTWGLTVKATEAPHYRRYALTQHDRSGRPPMAGVNDGNGILFVDHRGEVFPSGFLPVSAGNVRTESLRAIYRESPLFLSLRDPGQLGGKCGLCEFNKVCGGSRARSYHMTGDWLGAEPCCVYISSKASEELGMVAV